jgi:Ca2+-binding EF-hand superfamily protein
MYKEVVCSAFAKYDKDGSNAIDKDELAALMKSLGKEIDDDQVTKALKDLDINKDGVIDLSEFSRWFFTGMQSYGGVSRTLLKLKKGTGAGGILTSFKD